MFSVGRKNFEGNGSIIACRFQLRDMLWPIDGGPGRSPQGEMLVGSAIIVREMDVQQFASEPIQILFPPILVGLQLGMAAVQMKPQQGHLIQDFYQPCAAT
jgi:hypothetical protein